MGQTVIDGPRRGRNRWLIVAGAIVLVLGAIGAVHAASVWNEAGSAESHGHTEHSAHPVRLRLGVPDSPLLAAAHLASARGAPWTEVRVASPSAVGYALLAGTLDAGFIAADQVQALRKQAGSLQIVGAVTFPYGASVVARKGSNLRLEDLSKARIAAAGPGCALLRQFTADATTRGLATADLRIVTTPCDVMVPALESGTVDAAVMRASESLIAARAGHQVLYQNWAMQAGDECCPPVIFQTQFVLVAREPHPDLYGAVVALALAAEAAPSALRLATAKATDFPALVLERFPAPSFIVPDAAARSALAGTGHHHDD